MITQITMLRNELFLLKELLPVWKRFSDNFVFVDDGSTDGSYEYLNSKEIRNKYGICDIIRIDRNDNDLSFETDIRQKLFDRGLSLSNNILCLDADEYLDGNMTKPELEELLSQNNDTVFHLQWIQYTSKNTIRVDGPWKLNFKDRIGNYSSNCLFQKSQMHSTHLPIPKNEKAIDPSKLFISHLQWIDKNYVGIKQYFWKTVDYMTSNLHNVSVAGNAAYDQSVNNFEWEEEYFDFELKIRGDIFEDISNSKNYRVGFIQKFSKEHNIPNLGDWGLNIVDSIPMYFCTAADSKHYPILMNMLGSLCKYHFYDIEEILVYDLGLTGIQLCELRNIKKVTVCEIEKTNDKIFDMIETGINRSVRGLFSWKPVVIKDALDRHPYTLYLDAGTTILKPLNNLFKHIKQNGYLLFDCGHSIKWMTPKHLIDKFNLTSIENQHILDDSTLGIDAGFQGVSRSMYDNYVYPAYELSKDIKNFIDDGSCPNGYGTARHDQTLYSILAEKLKLKKEIHWNESCSLFVDGNVIKFNITHNKSDINSNTTVFRSRWNIDYNTFKRNTTHLRRKYDVSCVTAIGKLEKYGKFIDSYFSNIQKQINFEKIEFIIVYSEWSDIFDSYLNLENIKFVKEDAQLGVYNAWNIGIKNSTSEYVTNWNVDDLRYPINNKIKFDMLSKNIDIDIAYNYYSAMTESELLQNVEPTSKPIQMYPDDYHLYTHVACMAGPDPMWRRAFHIFGGYFNWNDYSIIGDWEMWRRMSRLGLKFKLIPEILTVYVDHDDTVSKSCNLKLEEQKNKLSNEYGK